MLPPCQAGRVRRLPGQAVYTRGLGIPADERRVLVNTLRPNRREPQLKNKIRANEARNVIRRSLTEGRAV